jgi:glutamate racemase
MRESDPIGIFDSGIGGLTVVSQIEAYLPREHIVYFGDTARVPYGTKSKETITKFSVENVEFLIRHHVKIVVVACNTASSLSLDLLKRCFKVPIIGVIRPGARRAASLTSNNRVGVIGTKATIGSGAYQRELRNAKSGITVFSQACPLFVPLVEEGWLDGKVTFEVARHYLGGLKGRGIDTLILGCTHYPLLKGVIRDVMGKGVTLVDSAEEVAMEVDRILDAHALASRSRARPSYKFFVSDDPRHFAEVGERFLKQKIRCAKRVS